MNYPTAESLTQSFGLTHRIIQMQIKGLSHADSLLQLPFRGNCLNWVLGHVIVGRNSAIKLLGESPIWNEAQAACYEQGSEPLVSEGQGQSLEELVRALDQSQEQITAALGRVSEERLGEVVETGETLGVTLSGLHWHETYHTGQLEILRQLAGRDDVVIP